MLEHLGGGVDGVGAAACDGPAVSFGLPVGGFGGRIVGLEGIAGEDRCSREDARLEKVASGQVRNAWWGLHLGIFR